MDVLYGLRRVLRQVPSRDEVAHEARRITAQNQSHLSQIIGEPDAPIEEQDEEKKELGEEEEFMEDEEEQHVAAERVARQMGQIRRLDWLGRPLLTLLLAELWIATIFLAIRRRRSPVEPKRNRFSRYMEGLVATVFPAGYLFFYTSAAAFGPRSWLHGSDTAHATDNSSSSALAERNSPS